MTFRIRCLLAMLLICAAGPAFAGLEIKKALYGSETAYRDVRGILAAYARNKTLSFPVNARSMGGDPTRRQRDFLVVEYRANGRDFSDTVPEGTTFTFQGLPNVLRAKGFLPFLPPPAPRATQLLIINRTNVPIRVYNIDRFGSWVWTADVLKGQTITLHGRVGEEWIAADIGARILSRARLSRADNTFAVDPP